MQECDASKVRKNMWCKSRKQRIVIEKKGFSGVRGGNKYSKSRCRWPWLLTKQAWHCLNLPSISSIFLWTQRESPFPKGHDKSICTFLLLLPPSYFPFLILWLYKTYHPRRNQKNEHHPHTRPRIYLMKSLWLLCHRNEKQWLYKNPVCILSDEREEARYKEF